MRGRLAALMASGDFFEFIHSLLDKAYNTLLVELAVLGLVGEDLGTVMRAFDSGTRFIWQPRTMKLSFWRQLPWVIMGSSHYDVDRARRCARRALRLFQALGPGAVVHLLT